MSETLDPRIEGIHAYGCGFGKVLEQKTRTMERCVSSIEAKLDSLSNKLMGGIIVVIILAFLAGINVWEGVIRTFVTK